MIMQGMPDDQPDLGYRIRPEKSRDRNTQYSSSMPENAAQVYQPSEDTRLLLEAAQKELRPGDRVLEVGTGSGYIAARLPRGTDVVATDINPHAVAAARREGVSVIRADLFAGIRGPFDLIVFNPPYLPTREEERIDDWLEYALDGGETGRVVIERFAGEVHRVLAPAGRILIIISSLTGVSRVCSLFQEERYCVEIVSRAPVFGGEELVVLRCVPDTHHRKKTDHSG
jgi:release factor glutamine methyltransferase